VYTDGLRHDGGPVGRREVLGVLDVVGAVLHVPVAVRDVDLQQVLDAVLQVAAEMMRKLELHARTASFAPPGRLVLSRDPNSGIRGAWKSPLGDGDFCHPMWSTGEMSYHAFSPFSLTYMMRTFYLYFSLVIFTAM